MNIPDEVLWEQFETVYEPGSRTSVEWAQDHQPDVLDGIRAVAEWARKEALREAIKAVEGVYIVEDASDGDGGDIFWDIDPTPFADAIRALRKEARNDPILTLQRPRTQHRDPPDAGRTAPTPRSEMDRADAPMGPALRQPART